MEVYTGISLLSSSLTCSLFSVGSAAVCSYVVGGTGSYSPVISVSVAGNQCFSFACRSGRLHTSFQVVVSPFKALSDAYFLC